MNSSNSERWSAQNQRIYPKLADEALRNSECIAFWPMKRQNYRTYRILVDEVNKIKINERTVHCDRSVADPRHYSNWRKLNNTFLKLQSPQTNQRTNLRMNLQTKANRHDAKMCAPYCVLLSQKICIKCLYKLVIHNNFRKNRDLLLEKSK